MRGRSYSPSPPRGGYSRRGRSPSPRGRYGGRGGGGGGGRDLSTSLLVRNLRHDCRSEDLRRPFGQFGALKDIYLPKDYYSGEPRGFGFVQYVDPADAEDAKYQMDGTVLLGRQLTVVFAEENRKKPQDMRGRDRPSRGRHFDRRRSPPRHSRSPPPRYERSRSHSRGHDSPPPKRRQYSRSLSPLEEKRYSREKSYSHSPGYDGRGQNPIQERSPPPYNNHGRGSRSRSPVRGARLPPVRGPPSRSVSRSRSPAEYSPKRDVSPSP